MKNYITALTIAGSDCSGGAGIQADLKTFAALGCYGMSVITALTAQNTQGVQAIQTIPATFITEQLKSIFADIEVKAIKIGMLFSEEIIRAIKEFLQDHRQIPIVLDPVMIAKGGSLLLAENASQALQELFPFATLLTPNIHEAEFILKKPIPDRSAMQQAAQELTELGAKAVLVKGGHLTTGLTRKDEIQGKSERRSGVYKLVNEHSERAFNAVDRFSWKSGLDSDDCLYIKSQKTFSWFKARRIVTENTHGTGCTLSAAIAAFLAQGHDLMAAVSAAKKYISEAIKAGKDYQLGQGHGPVRHFFVPEDRG